MRAIDTNILVRVVAKDHKRQLEAALLTISEGAWISHLVLAESAWVLTSHYGLSRTELANTIHVLLNHETFVVQDSDVVAMALRSFSANKKVSFTDCLLLEIARKAGHTPLTTFDRDLAKIDGVERIGSAS
ncbi:MAG: type II toxin-antitoxin system VapC family toxin [Hyphomonadaceae bacterium]|nr:type II toxin-antitoxin system VapC family toxin [Hyphomonadaceae bacterium]